MSGDRRWHAPLLGLAILALGLVAMGVTLHGQSGIFMPHGHCYLWQPSLLWLHVISDGLIGLAYLAIAAVLYALVRRVELPFGPMVLAFGLFIAACGATHLLEVWNVWHSDYWVAGAVKALTALASVATAVYLVPVWPQVLKVVADARSGDAQRQQLAVQNQELNRLNAEVESLAREQVRLREERYRALALATSLAVWTTDPDGKVVEESESWRAFTGRSMLGPDSKEPIHPDDRPLLAAAWREALARRDHLRVEYRLRRHDGVYVPTLAQATPVRDAQGRIREWVGCNVDLGPLRRAEAQFRQVVENLPDLAWSATADGHIDFFNRRWFEYTGTTPEEMEGWGWTKVHDPALLPQVERDWREALRSGQPTEMQFPLRGADGQYRWFLTRVRPLRDAEGMVFRWIGTNTDIDEQRRTAAALRDAVAARDEFLTVASHELKTPLTGAKLSLELLQRALPEALPRAVGSRVEALDRQLDRLAALVQSLLDVSLVQEGRLAIQPEALDAAQLVRGVCRRFEPAAAQAGSRLELELPDALPVKWDPVRADQILSNLLSNALKFGQGKPVEVRLSAAGAKVKLEVRDHGVGIPEDVLHRLFRRFERGAATRNIGGLGLGLYISRKLAVALGGELQVESELGAGARFEAELPREVPAEVPADLRS